MQNTDGQTRPDGSLFHKPWKDQRATEIVLRLPDQICVDPKRIYAVGNGSGHMAVAGLACGRQVAAAALTNSRNHYFRESPTLLSCDPVPLLYIEPTKHPRRPVGGGYPDRCENSKMTNISDDRDIDSLEEYEFNLSEWSGCASKSKTPTSDGHSRITWEGCERRLAGWHVNGGEHWVEDVVGAEPECDGPVPTNFAYNEILWKFFAGVDAPKSARELGLHLRHRALRVTDQ